MRDVRVPPRRATPARPVVGVCVAAGLAACAATGAGPSAPANARPGATAAHPLWRLQPDPAAALDTGDGLHADVDLGALRGGPDRTLAFQFTASERGGVVDGSPHASSTGTNWSGSLDDDGGDWFLHRDASGLSGLVRTSDGWMATLVSTPDGVGRVRIAGRDDRIDCATENLRFVQFAGADTRSCKSGACTGRNRLDDARIDVKVVYTLAALKRRTGGIGAAHQRDFATALRPTLELARVAFARVASGLDVAFGEPQLTNAVEDMDFQSTLNDAEAGRSGWDQVLASRGGADLICAVVDLSQDRGRRCNGLASRLDSVKDLEPGSKFARAPFALVAVVAAVGEMSSIDGLRPAIVAHEVGHLLGAGHECSPNPSGTFLYGLDPTCHAQAYSPRSERDWGDVMAVGAPRVEATHSDCGVVTLSAAGAPACASYQDNANTIRFTAPRIAKFRQ